MDFIKFFAAGKDYIYIPDGKNWDKLTKDDIKRICDRRRGIGADGIFTSYQNNPKIGQIRGFLQNGEIMRDLSTACVCAVFAANSKEDITECETDGEFCKKISIFYDKNTDSSMFSCDIGCAAPCLYVDRKTEIGNRILTLTCVNLHGVHTVHFSECLDSLDINYLGKYISVNSLFNKKADITIAQKISGNAFLMKHYENGTGNPYPTLSAFAATAIAACKTGYAGYCEEIRLECNDTDIYAFCNKNNSCVIQGNGSMVFTGKS